MKQIKFTEACKEITQTQIFWIFPFFAFAFRTYFQALPGDWGSWASGLGDLGYYIITTQ
jgi:hypothetical protein